MKRFKELIRSRRGIAIEFAIGVMFVSVAISTILISTAVLEGERRRSDMDKFETFISESNAASLNIERHIKDMIEKSQDHIEIKDGAYSLTLIGEPSNGKFVLENSVGEEIATIIYNQSTEAFTYDWH